MELELKHLAPYLPYKLQWGFEGEDFSHEVLGFELNTVHLLSPFNDYGRCTFHEGKPILRPLSDLTKPIDGKSLLTIIAHNFFGYGSGYFSEPSFNVINENGFLGYQNDTKGIYFVKQEYDLGTDTYFTHATKSNNIWTEHKVTHQLEMFNELFKNHLDVFGLIDNGLAIDINQTNPDPSH